MRRILVTGATGFIGSNLIIELHKQGYNVRAFHRKDSNTSTINRLDVAHCLGDLRDESSLYKAIEGCDIVFHTAAIVSFWKKKRAEQLAINVGGTRHVVEACLKFGVKKLIHTSSVAALGFRKDGGLIDETTQYNWGIRNSYRYTKHLAEIEILKGIKKGLQATIVNPSIVIGPRDFNIHGGQFILGIKRGHIPAYINGGMNFVHVSDVVAGHISAAKQGRSGEHYILGGVNLTFKDFFDIVACEIGGKSPKLKVPNWLVKTIAKTSEFIGNITNTKPSLTSDLISSIGMNNRYSIEKAKKELSYFPTPIENAIREAYQWFNENNIH
jgi:dihydroflavonol-4-reductase